MGEIGKDLKKKAVCIEIVDKRDYYIAKALKEEGFLAFAMGEEEKYNAYQKVYVLSILTSVTKEIVLQLEDNAMLFCRGVDDKVQSLLDEKNIKVYNLLQHQTFIVKNAYLTAEGALGYIIFNTPTSIRQQKVLVLGYGRVGKSMTKVLKDNYAFVAVATDNKKEYSEATILADNVYTLSNYNITVKEFSVIINTIPKKILQGDTLELIDKDCFVLDLASNPGGVDFGKAKSLGLNVMHALGVPGKVAPKTAGLYIKDIIIEVLEKEI